MVLSRGRCGMRGVGGGGVMIDAVTGLKNSWETLLPVNFFKSMPQNNRSMFAAKILQFLHKNSYFLYKIKKNTMKRINFKTYLFKMSRVDK